MKAIVSEFKKRSNDAEYMTLISADRTKACAKEQDNAPQRLRFDMQKVCSSWPCVKAIALEFKNRSNEAGTNVEHSKPALKLGISVSNMRQTYERPTSAA